VDPHNGVGRVTMKSKGLTFTFDLKGSLAPGNEGDFLIRPEEVMFIREGKPIKESLKGNIFEGEIKKIIERETHYTLLLSEMEKRVVLEAYIPNYVFRNLKLLDYPWRR
jgi:hypothetical protein